MNTTNFSKYLVTSLLLLLSSLASANSSCDKQKLNWNKNPLYTPEIKHANMKKCLAFYNWAATRNKKPLEVIYIAQKTITCTKKAKLEEVWNIVHGHGGRYYATNINKNHSECIASDLWGIGRIIESTTESNVVKLQYIYYTGSGTDSVKETWFHLDSLEIYQDFVNRSA